ncbi:hypothetical protein BDV95DRAFT_19561 [Massariosphaeria phaeospora]|uniref:Uncharacterized protein n=1 Tax=Massariosphaeria phaeospora TaxID=100035 RepID=A0A7C8IIB8_9PLEO|nr:hypothetical protein BDV95DRAFT_19561 [Massariosphaeria phaeospora]
MQQCPIRAPLYDTWKLTSAEHPAQFRTLQREHINITKPDASHARSHTHHPLVFSKYVPPPYTAQPSPAQSPRTIRYQTPPSISIPSITPTQLPSSTHTHSTYPRQNTHPRTPSHPIPSLNPNPCPPDPSNQTPPARACHGLSIVPPTRKPSPTCRL